MTAPDETLLFLFTWEAPYTDAVHVRGEHDTTAVRASDDDAGPNLFTGDGVVWKAEGDLAEVVADLLALPAPGEPGAPTRIVRAPSRLCAPGDCLPLPPLFGPVPFL